MFVDFIVIVPLECEFQEFRRVFELGTNLTQDTMPTYAFEHGGMKGIVILQDEMGYWGAARAANSIIGNYNTNLLICSGIAGALSNDVKICDVCYSGTIVDTINNGKIEDGDDGGEDLALSPNFVSTPKRLHGTLTFLRVMPEYETAYQIWQQECQENEAVEAVKEGLVEYTTSEPESHQGDIACGLVSKSASYKAKLKNVNRKILAIETESGAVARFCADNGFDFLAIRGICDNADAQKNALEERTRNVPRRAAAFNAFSFLKMQIEVNDFFREYVRERRPASESQPDLNLGGTPPANALAEAQRTLMEATVEKLKETNQSFRTLPEGSLLPMPRLRLRPTRGRSASQTDPIEVREAVAQHQRVFATIPRVFPDKSLPWLVAHSLHYEQWNGRQLVPIVISGYDVRPPRGELDRLAPVSIADVEAAGGTIVFVIDDFPVRSSTNSKFLGGQIEKYPNSRFIILCNDTPDIKDVEDFVEACSADHADIVDTSFAEITGFLAVHFSIANDQAQVIALKLTELFKKFGLQVHPTFFAGIPQELIAGLLDANRRGELIQLAVDGYLTHVVAGDREKGRLSRTTRAEFLKLFIREMKISKRSMCLDDARKLTEAEFERRGYPNDARLFVDRFIETNVLIEVDGKLDFGLTFIEAYFTARELCNSSQEALAYFDLSAEDFDFPAFDLYCEICAEPEFVENLLVQLRDLRLMKEDLNKTSPLKTNSVSPNLLKHKDATAAVQRRIDVAQKAISDGRDETKEKQRLLDVADKVLGEARIAHKSKNRQKNNGDSSSDIDYHLKLWYLAVVLLGQGSESLSGETKDELAAISSRLGARLIDEWVSMNNQIDFESFKKELTKKENLERIIDPTLEIPSSLDPKELISIMVDIAEMSILSTPFPIVMGHLADEAKHRVLLPSIKKVKPEDFLERAVQASWLGEVDIDEAQPYLKRMVRDLPSFSFFRHVLSAYYVYRVYWNMDVKAARLQLLSLANEILRPLGRTLPVRQIEQSLQRSNEGGTSPKS